MKTIFKINKLWLAVIAMVAVFQTSCNEDFPNILKEKYEDQEMGKSLNKVLVVVVDGIRGNALMEIDPENLRKVARNSFYSNSSLGDYNGNVDFTKEIGLANIFTGVTTPKHGVTSDLSSIDIQNYPTVFDRLNENYSEFNSRAFTTNTELKNNLFKSVKDAQVVNSDEEVLSKTKEAILEDDIQMVVTHLSDIDKIGAANSYDSDDANYRQAILKFDNQVLDLIKTLESRPNYKNENWLVIFTSSIGGEIAAGNGGDETVYGDNKRNTFTYFYSPRFTRKYQAKPSTNSIPFTGSGLHLSYGTSANNALSARLQDVSKIGLSGTSSFTITFFYKMNTKHSGYPPIVLHRLQTDDGAGWQFIMSEESLQFGASGIAKIKTANVTDNKWHAITVSVNRTANTAKIYTDGVLSNQTTAGTSSLINQNPLIIGKVPNNTNNSGDYIVCNLQIYNVAMTDDEVKEYARLGLVKPDNSPFYNNLLGYWPTYSDVGTDKVTDVTEKAGNLKIYNEVKWASFDEYVPYFRPDVNETTFKLVPNQVDIPFFIFQWFGVLPKSEWKLDGQAWTPPYAVLEY